MLKTRVTELGEGYSIRREFNDSLSATNVPQLDVMMAQHAHVRTFIQGGAEYSCIFQVVEPEWLLLIDASVVARLPLIPEHTEYGGVPIDNPRCVSRQEAWFVLSQCLVALMRDRPRDYK